MITKKRWDTYLEKVWSPVHPINQGYVTQYALCGHEEASPVVDDLMRTRTHARPTRAQFRAREEASYQ
jgi:hypothetical protein